MPQQTTTKPSITEKTNPSITEKKQPIIEDIKNKHPKGLNPTHVIINYLVL